MHFTPTLGIRDTSTNARNFLRGNIETFWEIFKPLAPYILALTLIDLIVPVLFFEPDPETGEYKDFILGEILAGYFYACLMISWHRIVIHGPQHYEPVNPLRPRKNELVFMGMGIVLSIAIFFVIGLAVGIVAGISHLTAGAFNPLIAFIILLPVIVFAVYVGFRVVFYFPAKATGNNLSLREAFRMTKGYVWKFMAASFLAVIRLSLMMMLYSIVGIGIILALGFILPQAAFESDIVPITIGLLYALPIILYFQPILTVLGVTVLSNYYQYAMQHGSSSQLETARG